MAENAIALVGPGTPAPAATCPAAGVPARLAVAVKAEFPARLHVTLDYTFYSPIAVSSA